MNFQFVKAVCAEMAHRLGGRVKAHAQGPALQEQIQTKNDEITAMNQELDAWKQKFDRVWSAWHKLAIETKGQEEADRMSAELKG